MTRSALDPPRTDPTPIFEHFRGSYATELLTAAVAHFDLFGRLGGKSLTVAELGELLGLVARPTVVLSTALRAMGYLELVDGRLCATAIAREHLARDAEFEVAGYLGLAASAPGVLEMVERLRSNRPAGADAEGAAFIYKEGLDSAMEAADSARRLTLSLAGRARNVAPHLAPLLDLSGSKTLLDVGAGSAIYAVACLQRNAKLDAIAWDRPEVLRVARESAEAHGVAERLRLVPGDMFADPVPAGADVILLSNILHDWDVPDCRRLVAKLAGALPMGGKLVVHDVFLDDDLGGPLPIALYSASLFTLTEGRAYSAGEYRSWLEEAGLTVGEVRPTSVHCGAMVGVRG